MTTSPLKMTKKILIIGSGFSSISAATYLADKGYDVTVFEKNSSFGGRARKFEANGFTFDMGPSWYWMPDVFEKYFNDFNKKVSEYYNIKKLDPAYTVYFGSNDSIEIKGDIDSICKTFDEHEKGASKSLKKFMSQANKNYSIAMDKIVYKPGISIFELITFQTITRIRYFLTNIKSEVAKYFKNKKLRQILEFPVLFLGAKPENTPAFYNIMNHADFGLGTWFPEKGGMYRVIESMIELAIEKKVKFKSNHNVDKLVVDANKIKGVESNGQFFSFDIIISGADYNHTETLLPKELRNYSESFWSKQVFAPSSLLFYLGLDKKVKKLNHHNLFFDVDFNKHASEIYDNPKWPESPLFYVNFPSITDSDMAPSGHENCFILIPIAPGLEDNDQIREKYFKIVIDRIEKISGEKILDHIVYKKSFCVKDFIGDYNSYRGNAYGLANTLFQTSIFKPKIKSKKVKGLYFTGQLTVPGPGVPPSLISGKIVSDIVMQDFPY